MDIRERIAKGAYQFEAPNRDDDEEFLTLEQEVRRLRKALKEAQYKRNTRSRELNRDAMLRRTQAMTALRHDLETIYVHPDIPRFKLDELWEKAYMRGRSGGVAKIVDEYEDLASLVL